MEINTCPFKKIILKDYNTIQAWDADHTMHLPYRWIDSVDLTETKLCKWIFQDIKPIQDKQVQNLNVRLS